MAFFCSGTFWARCRYLLFGVMVTTAISLPSQALALSPPEVSQRAKAFVVRIDGTIRDAIDLASGSIIGKNGDLYQVLTVWHAVDDGPGVSYYRITTSDGKTHAIVNYTRLDGSTNVDLVLLVFRSDQNYAVAKLGSSQDISEGKTVHYAGYPAMSPRLYRFQGSEQILSVMPMAQVVNLGYMVFHSGELVGGMSGGPLLDNEARIIGVFGQGETTIEGGATLKSIPIDLVKELAQRQNIALLTSPTPTPSPTPQETPIPKPTPTPAQTLVSRTTGVDYTPLRRLLQAGEWKQADQKTLDLMLAAANRVDAGRLNNDSLDQFPCEDLRIIDQEWADASNGKFGFAAQQRVWEEVGSPGNWDDSTAYGGMRVDDPTAAKWRRMYIRLGWKTGSENDWHDYVDYDNLQFSSTAINGHLPTLLYRDATEYMYIKKNGGTISQSLLKPESWVRDGGAETFSRVARCIFRNSIPDTLQALSMEELILKTQAKTNPGTISTSSP